MRLELFKSSRLRNWCQLAAILHGIDSIFNSAKGSPPQL
jgi:hypothetical protein